MKTRFALVSLALLAASCKTQNERSDLVINKVVPATASVVGTAPSQSLNCVFDIAAAEYTPGLPYNPAESTGVVGAVIQNRMLDNSVINPEFRLDTNTFLPHQAVINYEVIPSSAGAAPPQNVVPAGGNTIPTSGTGVVGVEMFRGLAIALPAGTFVRTTFHLEGKLLDGSTVKTADREYLFQVCNVPGCSLGGIWTIDVNGAPASCL